MKLLAPAAAFCALTFLCFAQSSLEEFQKILESNPKSSRAHYGIAEIHFQRRSYQAAANAYRDALSGDLQPKWVKVWSHINLGKIFDITGQRNRAINEYTLAINTRDDTNGALTEAEKYLATPYTPGR